MSTKNTLTTTIEEAKDLSSSLKKHLQSLNINTIGDTSSRDFMSLCAGLTSKETDDIYDLVYKANVEFNFDKNTLVKNLPKISDKNKDKLIVENFTTLASFEGVFYPQFYDLIGFAPSKSILVIIRSSGVEVKYRSPNWDENDWEVFVKELVKLELVTWEDVAICLCSELNPPQVGTAVAKQVKHNYPPREAMKHVMKWFYEQSGRCEESGKQIWLEADHKIPKEHFIRKGKDPTEANTLDNFQLLTKRENVIKRGSHRLGGLSFAQASATLVYILIRYRPKTYDAFSVLCREYGLTMASIRFQEAWALAEWLNKDGLYEITR